MTSVTRVLLWGCGSRTEDREQRSEQVTQRPWAAWEEGRSKGCPGPVVWRWSAAVGAVLCCCDKLGNAPGADLEARKSTIKGQPGEAFLWAVHGGAGGQEHTLSMLHPSSCHGSAEGGALVAQASCSGNGGSAWVSQDEMSGSKLTGGDRLGGQGSRLVKWWAIGEESGAWGHCRCQARTWALTE